jgi:hypothetical protein
VDVGATSIDFGQLTHRRGRSLAPAGGPHEQHQRRAHTIAADSARAGAQTNLIDIANELARLFDIYL